MDAGSLAEEEWEPIAVEEDGRMRWAVIADGRARADAVKLGDPFANLLGLMNLSPWMFHYTLPPDDCHVSLWCKCA